jgi:hypothetical protein
MQEMGIGSERFRAFPSQLEGFHRLSSIAGFATMNGQPPNMSPRVREGLLTGAALGRLPFFAPMPAIPGNPAFDSG